MFDSCVLQYSVKKPQIVKTHFFLGKNVAVPSALYYFSPQGLDSFTNIFSSDDKTFVWTPGCCKTVL